MGTPTTVLCALVQALWMPPSTPAARVAQATVTAGVRVKLSLVTAAVEAARGLNGADAARGWCWGLVKARGVHQGQSVNSPLTRSPVAASPAFPAAVAAAAAVPNRWFGSSAASSDDEHRIGNLRRAGAGKEASLPPREVPGGGTPSRGALRAAGGTPAAATSLRSSLTLPGGARRRASTHARYADELRRAGVVPPGLLPQLLAVLDALEYRPVLPSHRDGLHPLVLPLAVDVTDEDRGGGVIGLLLRPLLPTKSSPVPMPIVRSGPGGVDLIAFDAGQYIHRALVGEDAAGAAAAAAARAGAGDASVSSSSSRGAWLARPVAEAAGEAGLPS